MPGNSSKNRNKLKSKRKLRRGETKKSEQESPALGLGTQEGEAVYGRELDAFTRSLVLAEAGLEIKASGVGGYGLFASRLSHSSPR